MKQFLVAAAMAALSTPVAAYEKATSDECQKMWTAFFEMIPSDWGVFDQWSAVQSAATPEGWCRIKGGSAGLEDAEFGTFDWRVDGINRIIVDGIPPMAIEVLLQDVADIGSTPPPPVQAGMALRYDPASRSVLVEQLSMTGADGDSASVTAVVNHLDFSSRGTVLMSVGGMAVSQLAGRMKVVGDDDLFGLRASSDMDKRDFIAALRALSNPPFEPDTIDNIAAFLDDDAQDGDLTITMFSERGLGLLQFISGWFIIGDDADGATLERMLDGLVINVDWSER